ncbi:Winged helix DNA-binding domain superfamily [Babesia duncani]|uniref:Winged helix DNA-binding domain superfamily n=1 Tax=Babesia duncani TaxID=323732 RepID=A0AAD9PKS5_9APIC|nr:Winged helix DNA-binding domain superfamily [Babesia duncani]
MSNKLNKRPPDSDPDKGDAKRHQTDPPSGHDNTSLEVILAKPHINDDDFKKILTEATPEQRLFFIQRQLGYYISHDNLSHDQFYHDKFKECSKNTGHENVLDTKYVLSAKRMVDIGAKPDDLKAALDIHAIPNVSLVDINGSLHVKLEKGLPPFSGKRFYEKKKKFGDTPDTFHAAGPLVIVSNIPAGIKEWSSVKEALQKASSSNIRFISPIGDEGRCFVWFSKNTKPSDVVDGISPTLEGNTLEIKLINDEQHYKEFLSAMLPSVVFSRSKDLQRIQSSTMASPIDIDGLTIRNFGFIKCLLNDFLNASQVGQRVALDSNAGKVLRYILDYHPNASEKKGGASKVLSCFEVVEDTGKDSKNKKRFSIILTDKKTSNETKEDVSLSKCIDGLRTVAYKLPKATGKEFIKSLID